MTVCSSIDIPLAPRMVHRFRLTTGVFEPGNATLRDLMVADGAGEAARACVYLDSGLAAAQPGLADSIRGYLASSPASHRLVLPPRVIPGGESAKNDRAALDEVIRHIHDGKLCRRSYAIAVGGGAVLDVVGLAAALTHRGVRLIRIPTTTLSQGDSCVAVKNGINLFGTKNYLGSFAAPWGVVLDPSLLSTLAERDWRAGFSEAVKVALVKDGAFFDHLESAAAAIAARDPAASMSAIRRSAELHLRHITDGGDPFELSEARPLDFGHWAAHRLEALTGFELKHGEAVAVGIAIDTEYSRLAGLLGEGDRDRVLACLTRLGFHLSHPALRDSAALMAGIDDFREHLGGRLTLAMLAGIGRGRDIHDIDRRLMSRAIVNIHALAQ